MAYENINVSSLKSALTSCQDSINYAMSLNLISELSSNTFWICNAKSNVINGLTKLVNEHYRNLEKTLSRYQVIAIQIENYQKLAAMNASLIEKNTVLEKKLYYEEEYEEWEIDSKTKQKVWETHTRTVKDTEVEAKINSNNKLIKENKMKMSSLESTINNSV